MPDSDNTQNKAALTGALGTIQPLAKINTSDRSFISRQSGKYSQKLAVLRL